METFLDEKIVLFTSIMLFVANSNTPAGPSVDDLETLSV